MEPLSSLEGNPGALREFVRRDLISTCGCVEACWGYACIWKGGRRLIIRLDALKTFNLSFLHCRHKHLFLTGWVLVSFSFTIVCSGRNMTRIAGNWELCLCLAFCIGAALISQVKESSLRSVSKQYMLRASSINTNQINQVFKYTKYFFLILEFFK